MSEKKFIKEIVIENEEDLLKKRQVVEEDLIDKEAEKRL